ncbi:MAG: hypothetical protein EPO32_01770 [Anaerolineae bacterium]|nr:MAG: hypothetical protein EPO32_01770 [Anaerolineae bacterium]
MLLSFLLVGCTPVPPAATAVPTANTAPAVISPTSTATRAVTATPTPLAPTSTPEVAFHFCTPPFQILTGHFVLAAPIGAEYNQSVSPGYRYGATGNGQFDVHHGVEFENRPGTPVLAPAAGVVVFAGPDDDALIAAWPQFYGNVIVLEHHFDGIAQPVFTVYGHLSTIGVTVGENVEAGQPIGQVGATGVALGNHLHFEVRFGENDYAATRNPELWIAPPEGTGALAVYVLDAAGQPVNGLPLVITRLDDESGQRTFLEPYGAGANGDDGWGEQYGASGLPAGRYRVAFTYGKPYSMDVTVDPGLLTLAAFCLGD